MLLNAGGGGGINFSGGKRYKCLRFNVISVTRGWGVQWCQSKYQKKSVK